MQGQRLQRHLRVQQPSTRPGGSHGFLFIGSTLNATGGASSNTIYLGRAWDKSVGSLSNYVNGPSPNGFFEYNNGGTGNGRHEFVAAPLCTVTAPSALRHALEEERVSQA
jgi:pectin methylesterase-like acyl-CoA thioesterase